MNFPSSQFFAWSICAWRSDGLSKEQVRSMLSDEHIKKFQTLYKKRFDKDLTPQEAHEKAVKLLGLVSIVYHPMKRTELEAVQQRQAQLLKKQK